MNIPGYNSWKREGRNMSVSPEQPLTSLYLNTCQQHSQLSYWRGCLTPGLRKAAVRNRGVQERTPSKWHMPLAHLFISSSYIKSHLFCLKTYHGNPNYWSKAINLFMRFQNRILVICKTGYGIRQSLSAFWNLHWRSQISLLHN